MDRAPWITATPNSVITDWDPGTTTIAWSAGAEAAAQIFVSRDGGPEKLFAGGTAGRPDGTREARWIVAGSTYEFRLYAAPERARLLASATVSGIEKQGSDEKNAQEGWYPKSIAVGKSKESTIAFLKTVSCLSIAEIGVYKGYTSLEIAKYLNGRGTLHLFDFSDQIDAVVAELNDAGFHNVVGYGNSRKVADSYNWSLMSILQNNPTPIYDYVFLDGAHTWGVDALAFFLIDRLLKDGGYIDFDDYGWSLKYSPSLNPTRFPPTDRMYTAEQIEERQVALIVELLVKRDHRYVEVVKNKIFQKTGQAVTQFDSIFDSTAPNAGAGLT